MQNPEGRGDVVFLVFGLFKVRFKSSFAKRAMECPKILLPFFPRKKLGSFMSIKMVETSSASGSGTHRTAVHSLLD